jgi:hypothetical protein
MLTSPAPVRVVRASFAKSGPFGWVGQPTCVQRLERTVKLGSPPRRPLLRTYAARREISPAAGSARNVTTVYLPSGNAPTGPRSTSRRRWPTKEGRIAKPATGSAIAPPTSAPSATVARPSSDCHVKRSSSYREKTSSGSLSIV